MAGGRILVVDDAPEIVRLLDTLLRAEGYEVEGAADLDEARASLSRGRFDLVFLDVVLERGRGTDLLPELSALDPPPAAVLMTGFPDMRDTVEALRRGAFDYLVKPVSIATLTSVTKRAISQVRLQAAKAAAEAEREEYRMHLETVFQSMEDGAVSVDRDGRIRMINRAAAELCGPAEPGAPLASFGASRPGCRGACRQAVEETLSHGLPIRDRRVRCGEGDAARSLLLSVTPLVADGESLCGALALLRDVSRIEFLERELYGVGNRGRLVGASLAMCEVFDRIERFAPSDVTVLITGESGTGKKLVAEALHEGSPRRAGPLVRMNAATFADGMVESELFGHAKGAFTGALRDREGRFEAARGGTLFIDEAADLPPAVQGKLLRALEERTIERVGESTPRKVDVRIVAATNRDLAALVREGKFREDLYFRLNVVEIRLPPLRARREDIPALTAHFVDRLNRRHKRNVIGITEEVRGMFERHSWPGNVRELRSAIEHAFAFGATEVIGAEHLPPWFREGAPLPGNPVGGGAAPAGVPVADRQGRILEALEAERWHLSRTAERLGVTRQTLHRWMKAFGLSKSGRHKR